MLETSTSGLRRRPRPRAVAWLYTGARSPFPTRRTAPSPTIWVPLTGIRPFRRLRLLRSLAPSTRPYESKDGCPPPDRRCSPGLRPSRALLRPSLETCSPCGRGCVRSRLASATTSGATARRQVRPLRPHGRDGLVGAPSLRSDRSTRVPPLGDISASLDLGAADRDRPRVVLGGSKDSNQRPVSERRECSPGVPCLVAGLAASRASPAWLPHREVSSPEG